MASPKPHFPSLSLVLILSFSTFQCSNAIGNGLPSDLYRQIRRWRVSLAFSKSSRLTKSTALISSSSISSSSNTHFFSLFILLYFAPHTTHRFLTVGFFSFRCRHETDELPPCSHNRCQDSATGRSV